MKKILLILSLAVVAAPLAVRAQNMYQMGTYWIDLETMAKVDSTPANIDSVNFKKLSKYTCRFDIVNLTGTIPTETQYKGRPFKIVDEGHISYSIPPHGKEVIIETNKEDEKLDDVPGNDFLFPVSDGVVHIQRFEGKTGYRVTKVDEWAKTRFRQVLPHTIVTQIKDKDDLLTPYLFYFMHTDRFIAFTSLNSRSIHKTVILDTKDNKAFPIDATICGAIRTENEIGLRGYLVRDDASKTMKVSMPGSSWALRDNNIAKLIGETIVSDTLLILARYHQGGAGISLAAFGVKSGKPVWNGEVKQAAGATTALYLSMYKNKIMMEVAQAGGSYLEVFDAANGKRTYSTL